MTRSLNALACFLTCLSALNASDILINTNFKWSELSATSLTTAGNNKSINITCPKGFISGGTNHYVVIDNSSPTAAGTITGATNASPIVVTSNGHSLSNGEFIVIKNVSGNTAANGTWVVANKTTNTFELAGSSGSGTFTTSTPTPAFERNWEAALVTSHTCSTAGVSGSLTVNTVNPHSSGYTIRSATSGVQEAINYGSSTTSGVGTYVYIDPGFNLIYAPISTNSFAVRLQGAGKASVLNAMARNQVVLNANRSSRVIAEDLHFVGLQDVPDGAGVKLVRLGGDSYYDAGAAADSVYTNVESVIRNCHFFRGEVGVFAEAVENALVQDNYFGDQSRASIDWGNRLFSDAGGGRIVGNTFLGAATYGIFHRGIGNTKITENSFNGMTYHIYMKTETSQVTASGATLTRSSGDKFVPFWGVQKAYVCVGGVYNTFVNSVASDTSLTLSSAPGVSGTVSFVYAPTGQLDISENTFDSGPNNNYAVYLTGTCQFYDLRIARNLFRNGYSAVSPYIGLKIDGPYNRGAIYGNVFRNDTSTTSTYGIQAIGTDLLSFNGNTMTGFVQPIQALWSSNFTINDNLIKCYGTGSSNVAIDLQAYGPVDASDNTIDNCLTGVKTASGVGVVYTLNQNRFRNTTNAYDISSGSTGTVMDIFNGVAYANLPPVGNGSLIFCSNCAIGASNTCAGSGSGAFAYRANGAWKCY